MDMPTEEARMDFWMFLFFDLMFFILGVVIDRWFLPHDVARGVVKVEQEQPEPGTFGPNFQAVLFLAQVDALIARMDEQQMDETIDEMQRRGW
jgi:hypothetical protein